MSEETLCLLLTAIGPTGILCLIFEKKNIRFALFALIANKTTTCFLFIYPSVCFLSIWIFPKLHYDQLYVKRVFKKI